MKFNIEEIYIEKKAEIIDTIAEFVAIESSFDASSIGPNKPFGEKIGNVFELVKRKCEQDKISYRDIDGYALELTLGEETTEDFGILSHLDTVPKQENWDTNPFSLTLKDNWYYGLGASDDKGPSAIIYVIIKYLNELGLKYKRQVKVVFGGAEERGFECLYYYFSKNKQMTFGVSPDANFPVINFEKSAYNFHFTKQYPQTKEAELNIVSVHCGTALNVVPQYANVQIKVKSEFVMEQLVNVLERTNSSYKINDLNIAIIFEGKPSHGMQPHLGENALYKFINLVQNFSLDSNFSSIVELFDKTILNDPYGEKLNIAKENQYGNTSNNLGLFNYENNKLEFSCNIRFTNALNISEVKKAVLDAFNEFEINVDGKDYHYVKEDSIIFQETKRAYESVTKLPFVALSTGGGTYARMLKNGLAFGPNVDDDVNMHQNNERISEKNIETTFKVYLQLINNVCIED